MAAMAMELDVDGGGLFDPGSFKDPEGRVCYIHGEVYRTLSLEAALRMEGLATAGTLDEFAADGLLIPTKLVSAPDIGLDPGWRGQTLLHHERIPFVSYPFEWSFEMLRDAALGTVALIEKCLARDLTLKDATAYNFALHRGRMVFFDTLSIDHYQPGTPWEGYSQFCREFLFPLMLTAHRQVEFQAWFRGELDGVGLANMARLMGWGGLFRPGVFRHVILQARLERSFGGKDVEVRSKFEKTAFSKELILSNLRNIRHLIKGLRYRPADSEWIDYTEQSSYSDQATRTKRDFVARAIERISPRRVADLGSNTGEYTLIAAEHADLVAAVDMDATCVDALYRRIRADELTNVWPTVGNLLNPTPSMGWSLNQRRSLLARIQCDAFLALALVHHLCIGGNVPLAACLDQFREIAPAGVVEWVGKDDAMVQQMLRNRTDVFADYCWEHFERLLRERFVVADVVESHGGARRLCLLLAKTS